MTVLAKHAAHLPPGDWELLFADPEAGIYTYFDFDPATDETRTYTVQDTVGEITDANRRFVADDPKGYKKDPDFWFAASIPNAIIHKWLVEEGIDVFSDNDWPAVKRKLNSSEYAFLRRGHFQL